MIRNETFSSLKIEHKEAVGLLSIGTFLEYFDLMIYVHMAVVLNEIFFPQTDPETKMLISAFGFCSTYILRPVGALIFGYIGDTLGRKITVVITTFIMAICCLTIANLPTYSQIGIAASWVVTLCRIMQGMSCMGEATGAELYLTETLKPPLVYPIVGLVVIFASIGTTAALAVATLVTSYGINWRCAFWSGAMVALIGTVARTTLRETPDFADAKRRTKNIINKITGNFEQLQNGVIYKEQIKLKSFFALFCIQCLWPVCLYFVYIYCGDILKKSFNFTSQQIIYQNFIVSCWQLLSYIFLIYCSYKIYPIKLLKIKMYIFSILIILCPFLLQNLHSSLDLLILQSIIVIAVPTDFPAVSIFYRNFPVLKRFTSACMAYGLARAFMSIIASFGLTQLIKYYDYYGILLIMIPILIGYAYGLLHFEDLEKITGMYPEKKILEEQSTWRLKDY